MLKICVVLCCIQSASTNVFKHRLYFLVNVQVVQSASRNLYHWISKTSTEESPIHTMPNSSCNHTNSQHRAATNQDWGERVITLNPIESLPSGLVAALLRCCREWIPFGRFSCCGPRLRAPHWIKWAQHRKRRTRGRRRRTMAAPRVGVTGVAATPGSRGTKAAWSRFV